MQRSIYAEVILRLGMHVIGYGPCPFSFCAVVVVAEKQGSRTVSKPLWRKREVVRQERLVQYTTIDAEGELQVVTLIFFLV